MRFFTVLWRFRAVIACFCAILVTFALMLPGSFSARLDMPAGDASDSLSPSPVFICADHSLFFLRLKRSTSDSSAPRIYPCARFDLSSGSGAPLLSGQTSAKPARVRHLSPIAQAVGGSDPPRCGLRLDKQA